MATDTVFISSSVGLASNNNILFRLHCKQCLFVTTFERVSHIFVGDMVTRHEAKAKGLSVLRHFFIQAELLEIELPVCMRNF